MPKEIGISNKDFGTYLKDDPSESKLPTNSLLNTYFLLIMYWFFIYFSNYNRSTQFCMIALGSNTISYLGMNF